METRFLTSITRTGYPVLVELINLLDDFTQTVNFPTRIPDWQSCLFGFISSDPSICSTLSFPQLGSSDHIVVSVSILFIAQLMIILVIIGTVLVITWEMFHVPLSNLVLLLLFLDFMSNSSYISFVYTRHHKCQVKPSSSPFSSAAYTIDITHRNQFFRLIQQNKSSASKVKFR